MVLVRQSVLVSMGCSSLVSMGVHCSSVSARDGGTRSLTPARGQSHLSRVASAVAACGVPLQQHGRPVEMQGAGSVAVADHEGRCNSRRQR